LKKDQGCSLCPKIELKLRAEGPEQMIMMMYIMMIMSLKRFNYNVCFQYNIVSDIILIVYCVCIWSKINSLNVNGDNHNSWAQFYYNQEYIFS
jgi:hypothetical protein